MSFLTAIFHAVLLVNLPYMCQLPNERIRSTGQTFDFIVVGAGSAGAVIAGRLSENPHVRVLLIEAGDYAPVLEDIPAAGPVFFNTPVDWQFKVAPQVDCFQSYPNRQPVYHQGKMLGGTSTMNDMMYIRGNRLDYDNWAALGNTGWDFKNVLPYFLKSEGNTVPWMKNDRVYHNTAGPLIVSEAEYRTPSLDVFLKSAEEAGYPVRDVDGRYQTGAMTIVFTMKDGVRWSTARAFLEPHKCQPNFVIYTNAFVKKVVFNGNRAVGVEYRKNGIDYTVRASKEVIISAGALGSPKILLLSGVGPAEQLRKFNIPVVMDLPGVGENLHDHVGCAYMIWKVNCSRCTYDLLDSISLSSFASWLKEGSGPLTAAYGNEGVLFFSTNRRNAEIDWPDADIQFVSANVAAFSQFITSVTGINSQIVQNYYKVFSRHKTFSMYPFILRPKSRGVVQLQSSNPFDSPWIDFKYLSHPDDIHNLVASIETAYRLGSSRAFRAFNAEFIPTSYPGCENVPRLTRDYWECACRHFTLTGFHAAGSCKMGPRSDKWAVVDPRLRVHNIIGLRVADASIMPEVVSGNPNAPVIMIGEKAADFIKQEYNL